MRTNCSRRVALWAAILAACGGRAWGTTDTYNSAVSSGSWSTAGNWSEGHVPNAGEDAVVKFTDALAHVVSLDVNSNALNSLLVDDTGGAVAFVQTSNVTMTATTVSVGSAGSATYNQSNGTVTTSNLDIEAGSGLPAAYQLSGVGKININAGGAMRLAPGTFSQAAASTTVTAGSGSEILIGISGGAGTYQQLAGTLTSGGSAADLFVGYSDSGTFNQTSGTVNWTGGLVDLGATAQGNGTYNKSGTGALSASSLFVGDFGGGTFVQSSGNVSIGGQITVGNWGGGTGQYQMTGGNLTLQGGLIGSHGVGDVYQNGGNVTSTAELTLGYYGGSAGTYELNLGTLSVTLLTLGRSGSATFTQTGGTVSVVATGGVNIGGVAADATYKLNGGNLTLGSGAILNNYGTLSMGGGVVNGAGNIANFGVIAGEGSLTVAGSFTNNGVITQSGGTLTIGNLAENFTNVGTITLSLPGQLRIATSFNNTGTINLNGGQLVSTGLGITNQGIVVGPGAISGIFTNGSSGLIAVPAGILTLPAETNAGAIQMTSVTALLNTGGGITNSGTIEGIGSITGSINNSGTIEAVGGTLFLSCVLNNAAGGTLRASAGNRLVVTPGLGSNAGIISLTGGTFDNNGNALDNTGQITGYGTFASGGLTNDGAVTFTGSGGGGTTTINGNVINSANRTINVKFDPAIFTGNVTNNGTIKITGTTVTFAGNYTGNTYLSDPATNIFQGTVTTTAGGLMSGSAGDVFNFAGGVFTNNGTFSNGGTLIVASGVVNAGSFAQTGPQTWLQGATLTNTGGTATFGSNAKLYGVTITGGTVDVTSSKLAVETSAATKGTMLASLRGYAASGSLVASGEPANFAVAVIDNGLLGRTSFGGLAVDGNSVLVAAELLGDANVDGKVDLTDLSTVLNNFGTATAEWTRGNFDYAGTIDLTDLSDVLNNFGLSNAGAGVRVGTAGPVAAPEGSMPGVMGIGMLLLVKNRRFHPPAAQ